MSETDSGEPYDADGDRDDDTGGRDDSGRDGGKNDAQGRDEQAKGRGGGNPESANLDDSADLGSSENADDSENGNGNGNGLKPAHRRYLKWIVGVVLVIVLTVEAILIWPELSSSVKTLGDLHWQWVVAAIGASLLEMSSFARVQRTLLSAASVTVTQRQSLAVSYAANSMSVTLPGGPVLGTTFTYRQMRKWGASPVVATWQLVMAGLLQAAGLALLGLVGALLVGAATNPFSLIFSIGGFAAFVVLVQYAASNPGSLESIGIIALRGFNRLRKKPEHTWVRAWKRIVDQLGAVQLDRPHTLRAFSWSILNWLCDGACLAFAAYAIGGTPSLAGIAVAYAAGTAASRAIPLLPAGLGVMDAVLVPALTASGMTGAQALSAVVVYRLISFLMIAVIGWVVFALRYRGAPADDEPGPDLGTLWKDD
ncbi:lysylphosphatidylglycerol synthase transmembrane domain-containing protein [Rhodococcus phenolicus]|uniref:lysylphosphatidylglycerol synthase transmembrane domain-containing protein n=1 Tax=Rhodococcus phenolicus TaxID=263849 RepID=UPI000A4FBB27|nr:YbhN family protein [Rhodococcus phenolicus]